MTWLRITLAVAFVAMASAQHVQPLGGLVPVSAGQIPAHILATMGGNAIGNTAAFPGAGQQFNMNAFGSNVVPGVTSMNAWNPYTTFGAGSQTFGAGPQTFGAGPQTFGAAPTTFNPTTFGTSSTGFGLNTTPFGTSSTGFGLNPTPFGTSSTGFGLNPTTFGTSSTGFGLNPTPFGTSSTGFGLNTTPFGTSSTGFGLNPTTFGTSSTGFGLNPTTFGTSSTGFGLNPTTFGTNAMNLNPLPGQLGANTLGLTGNTYQTTMYPNTQNNVIPGLGNANVLGSQLGGTLVGGFGTPQINVGDLGLSQMSAGPLADAFGVDPRLAGSQMLNQQPLFAVDPYQTQTNTWNLDPAASQINIFPQQHQNLLSGGVIGQQGLQQDIFSGGVLGQQGMQQDIFSSGVLGQQGVPFALQQPGLFSSGAQSNIHGDQLNPAQFLTQQPMNFDVNSFQVQQQTQPAFQSFNTLDNSLPIVSTQGGWQTLGSISAQQGQSVLGGLSVQQPIVLGNNMLAQQQAFSNPGDMLGHLNVGNQFQQTATNTFNQPGVHDLMSEVSKQRMQLARHSQLLRNMGGRRDDMFGSAGFGNDFSGGLGFDMDDLYMGRGGGVFDNQDDLYVGDSLFL